MLVSLLSGLANVSTLSDSVGTSIGATLGVSMLLGIWLSGAVILGLCALLTQGPKIIETIERPSSSADAPSGPRRTLNPAMLVGGGVIILVVAASALNGIPSAPPTTIEPTQLDANGEATAPMAPAAPAPNWTYETERDEMRDATNRFASSASTNTVDMGFPYDTVQMRIMLRDHAEHGRDIMLVVSEGQYQCGYRGCSISAKFDDGEIQTFSVNEADGGTNGVLFIQNQPRFLAALRSAERVTIEARFYSRGSQQFSFNIGGLQWE